MVGDRLDAERVGGLVEDHPVICARREVELESAGPDETGRLVEIGEAIVPGPGRRRDALARGNALRIAREHDAGLGNGGLGRLAACFLESMGSVGVAGFGYGIRYDHGLFRQAFDDGRQIEKPEDWLSFGNPWQFERPEVAYEIGFGGEVETVDSADEERRARWRPVKRVLAVAWS